MASPSPQGCFDLKNGNILKLLYVQLSGKNVDKMVQILSSNSAITDLWLRHCTISEEGAAKFVENLPKFNLRTLLLTNISSSSSNDAIYTMMKGLEGSRLKSLTIIDTDLEPNVFQAIGGVIKQNVLEELSLYCTKCGQRGAAYLGEALEHGNTSLWKLDLNRNLINDNGFTHLARSFPKTKLAKVMLWGNDMKYFGIRKICRMVRKTPSIRNIFLSQVTSLDSTKSITEVCDMVEHSNIQSLTIDSSHLNDEAIAALAASISKNLLFTKLRLCKSELGHLQPLITVAKTHLRLDEMDFFASDVPQDQKDELQRVLCVRQSLRSKVLTALVGAHHIRDRIRSQQVNPCHILTVPKELLRRVAEML
jgi:hypothetical protein